MANPFEYRGNGQGFLTDYSGLAAAGSAFNSFAGAYQDAQDRSQKRLEQSAQIDALKAKADREKFQSQMDAAKEGYMQGPGGQLQEAPLSPKVQGQNQLKAIGEGVKATGFDVNNNPTSYETDPNSPKMQDIRAKNAMAGQRLANTSEGLAFREHKSAVGAVSDDKETKALLSGYQSINNALTNFKASGGMPQEFHQLQTALRLNAGSGNRTGVEERSKGYATDWGVSVDEAKQIMTGQISDVALNSPNMVKAIQGIAQAELANKQQQAKQQIAKKAGTLKGVYSKGKAGKFEPEFDDTVKSQYGQFGLDDQGNPQGMVPTGMVKPGLVPAPAGQAPPQDPKVAQYAKQYGLDYAHAQQILKARGYNGQ